LKDKNRNPAFAGFLGGLVAIYSVSIQQSDKKSNSLNN
jgi:hypothetical protein